MNSFTKPILVFILGCLSVSVGRGGVFTTQPFSGDADSGIDSSKTYTHAVDINGTGETINGVSFTAGGVTGPNYSLVIGAVGNYQNYVNNLTGNLNRLASNFYYWTNSSGGAPETLTLSGLVPGTTYKTVFYNVAFGGPGGRVVNVADNQDGAITYDENQAGNGNGSELIDTYIASSSSITYTFQPTSNTDSFHQYGFSNEVVVPEPASLALVAIFGLSLRLRRRA